MRRDLKRERKGQRECSKVNSVEEEERGEMPKEEGREKEEGGGSDMKNLQKMQRR